MAGRRNGFGYNDTTDCYRTFGGVRYVGWLVNPSPERIKAYRAAGIRCRKVAPDELFVAEPDLDAARQIDRTR